MGTLFEIILAGYALVIIFWALAVPAAALWFVIWLFKDHFKNEPTKPWSRP